MSHPAESLTKLSLQESALAADMFHRPADQAGSAVLGFVLREDGIRIHPNRAINFPALVEKFKADPIQALSYGREAVFAINNDPRLTDDERKDRVGRYLGAYHSLNLRLDHAAFPPSKKNDVQRGTPNYLPDGFVDMGSSPSPDPNYRSREMIVLDKAELFKAYHNDLLAIFTDPTISSMPKEDRDRRLATHLARFAYFQLPYNIQAAEQAKGGYQQLSALDQAVCRHLAMMYQNFCQLTGIESRLLKNDFSEKINGEWSKPGAHGANLLKLDDGWYLVDPTQPDVESRPDGQRVWKPGVFPIDGPPPPGAEHAVFEGTLAHSGQQKRYTFRNNCYWQVAQLHR